MEIITNMPPYETLLFLQFDKYEASYVKKTVYFLKKYILKCRQIYTAYINVTMWITIWLE